MAMKMAPVVNPRPDRVPEQEQSDPRNLLAMAAALGVFSRKSVVGPVSFRSGGSL